MKISQMDKRGQIVIPKDIREKLRINEGTGFFIYRISNNEILLKRIDEPKIEKSKIRARMEGRS